MKQLILRLPLFLLIVVTSTLGHGVTKNTRDVQSAYATGSNSFAGSFAGTGNQNFPGNPPGNVPYWWAGSNSPFKAAFEFFQKCHEKGNCYNVPVGGGLGGPVPGVPGNALGPRGDYPSNGCNNNGCGSPGGFENIPPFDFAKNPFFNGDFKGVQIESCSGNGCPGGKPQTSITTTECKGTNCKTNTQHTDATKIDLSNNPFFQPGFVGGQPTTGGGCNTGCQTNYPTNFGNTGPNTQPGGCSNPNGCTQFVGTGSTSTTTGGSFAGSHVTTGNNYGPQSQPNQPNQPLGHPSSIGPNDYSKTIPTTHPAQNIHNLGPGPQGTTNFGPHGTTQFGPTNNQPDYTSGPQTGPQGTQFGPSNQPGTSFQPPKNQPDYTTGPQNTNFGPTNNQPDYTSRPQGSNFGPSNNQPDYTSGPQNGPQGTTNVGPHGTTHFGPTGQTGPQGNTNFGPSGADDNLCYGQGLVCVKRHLCPNGFVNNNGEGLLNVRNGDHHCDEATEVCCQLPGSSGQPHNQQNLALPGSTFTARTHESSSSAASSATASRSSTSTTQINTGSLGPRFSPSIGSTKGPSASYEPVRPGIFQPNTQNNPGQTIPFGGRPGTSPGVIQVVSEDDQQFPVPINSKTRAPDLVRTAQATSFTPSIHPSTSIFGPEPASTNQVNFASTKVGVGYLPPSRSTDPIPDGNNFSPDLLPPTPKEYYTTTTQRPTYRPIVTQRPTYIPPEPKVTPSENQFRPTITGYPKVTPGYLPPDPNQIPSSSIDDKIYTKPDPNKKPQTDSQIVHISVIPSPTKPIPNRTKIPGTDIVPAPDDPRGTFLRPSTPSTNDFPVNVTPYAGCAAALKCVEEDYCTAAGVISTTRTVLTEEQQIYRVPLTECLIPESGQVGKCCRDPDYSDPWPSTQLDAATGTVTRNRPFQGFTNPPTKRRSGPFETTNTFEPSKAGTINNPNTFVPSRRPNPFGNPNTFQPTKIDTTNPFEPTRTGSFDNTNTFDSTKAGSFVTTNTFETKTGPFEPTKAGPFEPTRNSPLQPTRPSPFQPTRTGPFDTTNTFESTRNNPFELNTSPTSIEAISGDTCGRRDKNSSPRGQGPLDANFGEIPWQATIVRADNRPLCGGTIIQRNAVLTSASCIENLRSRDLFVRGGEWQIGAEVEPKRAQTVGVKAVVRQPGYEPTTKVNDMAILILEEAFNLDSHIDLLCLSNIDDTVETFRDKNCITTGWGKQALELNVVNSVLHILGVGLVKGNQCQQQLQRNGKSTQFYNENCVCGAPLQQGNICDVDRGSALACDRGDGRYVLAGVYSWESDCNPTAQIAGYNKPDTEWIKNILNQPENELLSLEEKYNAETGNGQQTINPGQPSNFPYENRFGGASNNVPTIAKLSDETCGARHENTSPRGSAPIDANFAEIPWQAMILRDTNRSLLCGGAIIRRNIVLTAAHCVDNLESRDVLVKGGEWKLGIDEEPKPFQINKVSAIVRHPGYNPKNKLNDIALLYLEEKFRVDKNVDTICLADEQEDIVKSFENKKCISTGWGTPALQLHIVNSLMHVIGVGIMKGSQCQQQLQQQHRDSAYLYNENCVCGAPAQPQGNICDVDKGSALACDRGDGRYVLAGIYSWETSCNPTAQIAGFSKIDSRWVEETIKRPIRELRTQEKGHYQQLLQASSQQECNCTPGK